MTKYPEKVGFWVHQTEFDILHKFPSLGFCLYCGTRALPLSVEHTFPDGMGGRHELPDASCRDCQDKLNKVEGHCQLHILGNPRAHYQIKSSSKKRHARRIPKIEVEKLDGTRGFIERPIGELPFLLSLPVMLKPRLLTGSDKKHQTGTWVSYSSDIEEYEKKLGIRRFIAPRGKLDLFALMVAKIAHAHTIALQPDVKIKPLLPDVILGRTDWRHLIGGIETAEDKDPKRTMVYVTCPPSVPRS